MTPLLQAQNLFKRFGSLQAVDDVSLNMVAGQCLGLLGPNGAGKTTTIEILEGIKQADAGTVLYKGKEQGDLFRHQAGIMFQATALQEYITVKETLVLFAGLYDNACDLDKLIETCALSEFLDQDNKKLSGGQRQRLLFAIALINNPDILFLDEPTTGLDPQSRQNFWSLINAIKKQGKTILLTTHYMEEAFELCDELVIMDHGKVISRGTPKALLNEHFDEVIMSLPSTELNNKSLFQTLNVRVNGDMVEILTKNVESTINELLKQGVSLNELRIREATLDDLFLKLTGQDLRS